MCFLTLGLTGTGREGKTQRQQVAEEGGASKKSDWVGIARLEELFHLLGNKHRLEILLALDNGHHGKSSPSPYYSFTELKEKLSYNSRTLSFHLGVLQDAGMVSRVVKENERGHHAMYQITESGRELLRRHDVKK